MTRRRGGERGIAKRGKNPTLFREGSSSCIAISACHEAVSMCRVSECDRTRHTAQPAQRRGMRTKLLVLVALTISLSLIERESRAEISFQGEPTVKTRRGARKCDPASVSVALERSADSHGALGNDYTCSRAIQRRLQLRLDTKASVAAGPLLIQRVASGNFFFMLSFFLPEAEGTPRLRFV